MKIAIATDHRGAKLKAELIKNLIERNYEISDCSPENHDTDDYPDFALKVALQVINKEVDFGVLICGSGIGMSIAANKVKGIRCARAIDVNDAIYSRKDNNANVIAFSSSINIDKSLEMINAFINQPFNTEEKYQRRIDKIIKIENGEYNEL